jgi:hypothetical protein
MTEDKKAAASHYARTRAELAGALGYEIDHLSAAQEMRLDNVVALRLVSDTMRAALMRGEQVDTRELLSVTDGLTKLLPREPEVEVADPHDDPHARLMEIIEGWVEADAATKRDEEAERRAQGLPADPKDARIAELEAEIARMRGEAPAALPSPDAKVITPRDSDIMEPFKDATGPQRGPDDRPTKSTQVIDGKAEPAVELMADGSPCPPGGRWCPVLRRVVPIPQQALSGAETERRRQAVNADRSTEFRIMNQPAGKGMPQPSVGGESWRGHTWRYE